MVVYVITESGGATIDTAPPGAELLIEYNMKQSIFDALTQINQRIAYIYADT